VPAREPLTDFPTAVALVDQAAELLAAALAKRPGFELEEMARLALTHIDRAVPALRAVMR
jgi:hypothetical protein